MSARYALRPARPFAIHSASSPHHAGSARQPGPPARARGDRWHSQRSTRSISSLPSPASTSSYDICL